MAWCGHGIKCSQGPFKEEKRAERHSESPASLALMDSLISSAGCSAEVIVLIPCHGCAAFSSLFYPFASFYLPPEAVVPREDCLHCSYGCVLLMAGLSSLSASAACNRRLTSGRGMQRVLIDHIKKKTPKHDRNVAALCQSHKNA